MNPGNDTNWLIWILGALGFVAAILTLARYDRFIPERPLRWLFWIGCAGGSIYILFLQPPGPDLVLCSNDGPLGIMASQHMRDAAAGGPGTPIYNDLYWLGQNSGSVPLTPSYHLMWVLNNPLGLLHSSGPWYLLAFGIGAGIGHLQNRRAARRRKTGSPLTRELPHYVDLQ